MKVAFSIVAWVFLGLSLVDAAAAGAERFRVAEYNLENYVEIGEAHRQPKALEAKAKIREGIRAVKPDVVALEEVGGLGALLELRDSLKLEGLELPYYEHVGGSDTNIHVAILSRFPFAARRPHTNDTFLLSGRRFRVSRGVAEVEIQVTPTYAFTLLVAHLKSKRVIAPADESEMRVEEGKLLREKIDALLAANPEANILVAGDLNDGPDAASTKVVIGKGKFKLLDTRPAELNGDDAAAPKGRGLRNITWTHFFAKDDTYSRIDYLLLSPGMAREWVAEETCVLRLPNWGIASDHRPIVAAFEAADR